MEEMKNIKGEDKEIVDESSSVAEEIAESSESPDVTAEINESADEKPVQKKNSMAKTIMHLLYIILFFAIALMPFLGMVFDWGGENMENRTLAKMPSLIEKGTEGVSLNTNFGQEFETYISDNFGFRQEVISVWSASQYYIFGESAVDDVVTGKDGWLFYTSTVADYEGTNLYTDRMIFRIAKTAELMESYAADSGAAFLFTIAPNKASVCPEYMDSKYKKSDVTNLSRLSETLSGSDYYLDLAELFNEKLDSNIQYYYKYDSHWNNLAATEVYREMQKILSASLADYSWNDYADIAYNETERVSDLSTMLLPQFNITEKEYEYNIPKLYSSKTPITNRLAVTIETTCPDASASLYMFRDSFGSSLIDTFSNNYTRVTYSRALPYDLCKAIDGQYNAIIVEIVERNMSEIVARVPIADAPPCAAPKYSKDSDVIAVCEAVKNDGKINISGVLSDDIALGDTDCIYVEFRESGNSVYFEAFPICEGDAYEDRGFSLTVPVAELLQGEYTMYLHVGDSDNTTAYALFTVQ